MIAPTLLLALVAPRPAEQITIIRDAYGVAHVYAASDAGAYYGAGYACARDRWFQMCMNRLEYRGQYAEYFGLGVPDGKHDQAFLRSDLFARVVGWERIAEREVALMPASMQSLLQAYADGVNAWVSSHPGETQAEFPIPLDEEWTATDCVGVWLRMSRAFQQWGLREYQEREQYDAAVDEGLTGLDLRKAVFGDNLIDDTAVSVFPEDFTPAEKADMLAFADKYGIPPNPGATLGTYTPPGFSEGAAIAADRIGGQHAVVIGTPRVATYWPNNFYEWHMRGESFDVRGWGIPGCANLYAGSSAHCAWSPQSMDLDMSDLFYVQVDETAPGGPLYEYDDQWIPFDLLEPETIEVLGGPDVVVTYRETRWGRDVTRLLGDGVGVPPFTRAYCLKMSIDAIPGVSTAAGFLDMYRATSLTEFFDATEGWVWPSVNLVFAAEDGTVGYTAVGAVPIRSTHEFAGSIALDGNDPENDWQVVETTGLPLLPHAFRPHALAPSRGWVSNGNNMPIGSWYPMHALFPDYGDNSRARRIRELASQDGLDQATAEAFVRDTVHSNTRDVVRLGLFLRDVQMYPGLAPKSLEALDLLEPWYDAGAKMEDSGLRGVLLAHEMKPTNIDQAHPDPSITKNYGSYAVGMCNFLKQKIALLEALDPPPSLSEDEAEVIDFFLARAQTRVDAIPGVSGPDDYLAHYDTLLSGSLERWRNLNNPAPPASTQSLPFGPVLTPHNGTIAAIKDVSFNQFVVVGEPDGASSLIALGVSERLGDLHATDQQALWEAGELKPSPTTTQGIQAMGPRTVEVIVMP